jgi:hypothetical protein
MLGFGKYLRDLMFPAVVFSDSFPPASFLPVSPDERSPQKNDKYDDRKSESPTRKSTFHARAGATLAGISPMG